MKILITFDLGDAFLKEIREAFPDQDFRAAYTTEEQLREAPDAEVIFGLLNRDLFLVSRSLRWFQFIGIGFDMVLTKIPEIIESDVVMTNSRETHVIPMADHVFAMILAFAHRVPELIEDQRTHLWNPEKYHRRMIELPGTTMGIVALGDIGSAVAKRAQGFDMNVYAVDIRPMTPPSGVREVWGMEKLDALIEVSDWLVVTAPLTEATRGMIDRARIERFKPGALLIVVSRGGIVEEAPLIEALRSGKIAGAGLDVMAEEPLPAGDPLWDAPNVLISPHTCADSAKIWDRRTEIFKENLRRYLAGEALKFVCDKRGGY